MSKFECTYNILRGPSNKFIEMNEGKPNYLNALDNLSEISSLDLVPGDIVKIK